MWYFKKWKQIFAKTHFKDSTKERGNLNPLHGNQIESHNKSNLGYEPDKNVKSLMKFAMLNKLLNEKPLNKISAKEMTTIIYFILLIKIMKENIVIVIDTFIKIIINAKLKTCILHIYVNMILIKKYSGTTYPTNIKRAKMIWVPKLNT